MSGQAHGSARAATAVAAHATVPQTSAVWWMRCSARPRSWRGEEAVQARVSAGTVAFFEGGAGGVGVALWRKDVGASHWRGAGEGKWLS